MPSIVISDVRLAFHDLDEEGQFEGRPCGYSATVLIPKGDPRIDKLLELEKAAHQAKWNGRKVALKADSGILKDGDLTEYAGFAGHMSLKANTSNKPRCFGRDKRMLEVARGTIYSGCYVDVSIDVWAQDNAYGKAIRASLNGVRFRRDGEPFAGGRPAEADDFEDLEDEDIFA